MKVYKLDSKYAQSLHHIMFAKFPEIVTDKCLMLEKLNDTFQTISHSLKLSYNIVIGLVALITKRNRMKEI